MELVQYTTKLLILLFVITCMASMGLSLKFSDIVKPLRRPLLVFITLAINFLVAPGIAILLTRLFSIDESYATGLLLLSAAAGAPYLPKLVEVAQGDATLSVSVMLLQIVGSIVLMPLILPLLLPGLQANVLSLALPLILEMFVPLALGLLFQQYAAGLAARIHPVLTHVSNLFLVVAVFLLLGTNIKGMLITLGSGAILMALFFVCLSMAVGFSGGQLGGGSGIVQALGCGQRNIAAALVIAASNHLSDEVVVMLLLTTFVGLIPLIGAAIYHRRQKTGLSKTNSH